MKLIYLFSKIVKKIQIPAVKNSKIDKTARICSASNIVDTYIGKYSYVGNSCTVINAKIGSFCSIADNSIIGGSSHPIEWVSTSPVFHEGINIMRKNFSSHEYKTCKETVIGNDVWIGNNALIKSGVVIADGAVIGMGSVLTKDVGDYEIWAGNPAKFIRKRFSNNVIENLLSTEWWNYNDSKLKKESIHFNDVNKYTNK